MAATAALSRSLIPVGEYLGSVYRPDVDYVDGFLEERNVGEIDHAVLQKVILLALTALEDAAGVYALQEARVQTQASRFRVPDICLIPAANIPEKIVSEPPLLCVEVLSPRDTVMAMRRRCMDYIRMGVPEVWIFDPSSSTAYVMRQDEMREVRAGELQLPQHEVRLMVQDVFQAAKKRTGRG